MEKQPSRKALMEKIDALEAKLRKAQQDLQRELARQSTSLADATMALKASDARYRALFERATDALFIENDRDEIIDVNDKACTLLGYTREELLAMTVADIQAPECRGDVGTVLCRELRDYQ